jgi:hypothetical protein
LHGRLGHACNEEAFRYLLGVQQRRSERSNRPFLLLLVDLKGRPGLEARIDRTIARPLFAGLCHALRETDVIGWYRDERTAGAVLTPCGDESCAEVARDVTQRVSTVLGEALPARVASRLLVRVCEFHPTLTS